MAPLDLFFDYLRIIIEKVNCWSNEALFLIPKVGEPNFVPVFASGGQDTRVRVHQCRQWSGNGPGLSPANPCSLGPLQNIGDSLGTFPNNPAEKLVLPSGDLSLDGLGGGLNGRCNDIIE